MDYTPVSRAVEILMRAKGYIGRHGWTQKRMYDENGFCLMGAILEANRQRRDQDLFQAVWFLAESMRHLRLAAGYATGQPDYTTSDDWNAHYVIVVNDNFISRKEEALELLDRSIRLAESTLVHPFYDGVIGTPERIIESVPEKMPVKAPEPTKVPEKVPAKVIWDDSVLTFTKVDMSDIFSYTVTGTMGEISSEYVKVLTNA